MCHHMCIMIKGNNIKRECMIMAFCNLVPAVSTVHVIANLHPGVVEL